MKSVCRHTATGIIYLPVQFYIKHFWFNKSQSIFLCIQFQEIIKIFKTISCIQLTNSSEPSAQSVEPSHTHVFGMQILLNSHVNSPSLHFPLGQFISSVLSPQSLSRSHFNEIGMHRPLPQVNSSPRHVWAKMERKNFKRRLNL